MYLVDLPFFGYSPRLAIHGEDGYHRRHHHYHHYR